MGQIFQGEEQTKSVSLFHNFVWEIMNILVEIFACIMFPLIFWRLGSAAMALVRQKYFWGFFIYFKW